MMLRAALAIVLPTLFVPATAQDRERASFALCGSGPRVTCVVDGDTFWYRGEKIRLSDINTPEVSQPACAQERALGERAQVRLLALLNAGPFTLAASGRDRDRYGRLLRVVLRDGESLGAMLVTEGLAEQWQGRRSDWCARLVLAR
jgi:micrococcal nuclease